MFNIGSMNEKCVNVSDYGIVRENLLVTARKCGGKQQQTSKNFSPCLDMNPVWKRTAGGDRNKL
jgi:hypothetical protein